MAILERIIDPLEIAVTPCDGLGGTTLTRRGKQAVGLLQRIALAILGGYSLTVLIIILLAWMSSSLVVRSEAVVLSAMLGFPLYLAILLWAFAEQRLRRLWAVLVVTPAIAHVMMRVLGGT